MSACTGEALAKTQEGQSGPKGSIYGWALTLLCHIQKFPFIQEGCRGILPMPLNGFGSFDPYGSKIPPSPPLRKGGIQAVG